MIDGKARESSTEEDRALPRSGDGLARPDPIPGRRQPTVSHPHQLPRHAWKDVLARTKDSLARDNVSLVAAGIAFFVFLGSIPALAATISIYGLIANTEQVREQIQQLSMVLPRGTEAVEEEIVNIATSGSVAGWGATFSLLLLLWSGSRATKALISAMNIAYNVKERRGLIRFNLLSLILTLVGVIIAMLAVGLVAALPAVLQHLGLAPWGERAVAWLRWPLLILAFLVGLSILYRYGPNKEKTSWRWVSWGAIAATLLWVAVSAMFSFYVSHFETYNKTYGSLGAIVMLLFWLYLTAFSAVAGAELNSEIEAHRLA